MGSKIYNKTLFLFLLFSFGFAKTGIVLKLEEPFLKPVVRVGIRHLYVYDIGRPIVYIYEKSTKRLKEKIEKKGEGPGEITWLSNLLIFSKYILLDGGKKLLYFTPEGKYIKEIRHPLFLRNCVPIKENYVCFTSSYEEEGLTIRVKEKIVIVNNNFKVLKTLSERKRLYMKKGKRIINLMDFFNFQVSNYKIFIGNIDKEGKIEVFDLEGNRIGTIEIPFQRRLVKENLKKALFKFLIESWGKETFKRFLMRNNYIWPKYYPPYVSFIVRKSTIYLFTWALDLKKNLQELVIMREHKMQKKRVKIPVYSPFDNMSYPGAMISTDIRNNRYYYFTLNKNDEWELHDFIIE